jgi:hypothetical protein
MRHLSHVSICLNESQSDMVSCVRPSHLSLESETDGQPGRSLELRRGHGARPSHLKSGRVPSGVSLRGSFASTKRALLRALALGSQPGSQPWVVTASTKGHWSMGPVWGVSTRVIRKHEASVFMDAESWGTRDTGRRDAGHAAFQRAPQRSAPRGLSIKLPGQRAALQQPRND